MAFQCCQHASLERCYNVYKLMLHETLRLENSFCLKNFISHKKLCFCDCFSNHQLFSLEIWNAKTTWKGGSFLFCKKKTFNIKWKEEELYSSTCHNIWHGISLIPISEIYGWYISFTFCIIYIRIIEILHCIL